jgi:hypothetical protein
LAELQDLAIQREPRRVIIKSRNKIFGKTQDHDQILAEIVKLARAGNKIKEISAITGKDRTTVWRYLAEAEQKDLIKKSPTGRIELSQSVKTRLDYEKMQKDEFVNKYPCVKQWYERRLASALGKPSKTKLVKHQLNRLKTICDTLELNPYAILAHEQGKPMYDGAENALLQFKKAMIEGKIKFDIGRNGGNKGHGARADNMDSRMRTYSQTIRNFCAHNNINIPPRIEGILTGKKFNFGKYAHIKLPFAKIDQCVNYLGDKYGYASNEQALFIFYYLTCARKGAGLDVTVDSVTKHDNGWVTAKVHETKTNTTWTKYLPSDNPHQKIFLDFLQKRKGHRFLFGDSEKELDNLYIDFVNVNRDCFISCGIKEDYFVNIKPVHAERHIGAHYWLNRPEVNYNHSIVARIGGWKDVNTLIQCYGAISEEFLMDLLTGKRQTLRFDF